MTIRECLERMRKVGAHLIYAKNGLCISTETDWNPYSAMSTVKMIDGKPVKRYIFCTVPESAQHLDVIAKYNIGGNDYIVKERDMNHFLNLNGGIDAYNTCSVPEFMLSDAMYLLNM